MVAKPQCPAALRTLGLDAASHASVASIKRAYLEAAKQHHPDRASSDAASKVSSERRFKEISAAYERLCSGTLVAQEVKPQWSRHTNTNASGTFINKLWDEGRSGRAWLRIYGLMFVLVVYMSLEERLGPKAKTPQPLHVQMREKAVAEDSEKR
eukprot:5838836-Prymnesium_polylepis.1